MNIARKLCLIPTTGRNKVSLRKFRFSAANYNSSLTSQPQVQEEKFDFEDIQVLERTERRKPKIPPFMKNVFVSIFNKDMLAYPEILNKEETEAMDKRLIAIQKVYSDSEKTKEDRRNILKQTKMYAAPVSLTKNGLAANCTESLRYLEVIGQDFELGQELSDHWVGLQALRIGLNQERYNAVIDDLVEGNKTIALCIKERVSERLTQADFRTVADMDGQGIWRITGEKVCAHTDRYQLVLSIVEGSRLRAFLVHPDAHGVISKDPFVTFNNTPATPLDACTEDQLADALALSRLYAATLCRVRLQKAVQAVCDYVKPRVYGGKPLSELSLIRAALGDALLDLYAGESAEYLSAGLLDGYTEPDVQVELAMCRNFMTSHGLSTALKLLSIPALDKQEECSQMLEDMRLLASRGETLDGANVFIAVAGIHHASKTMAEEIKQIRNPLMHPSFIIRKAFANRHQEKDDPKLDLYLAEHLHPSLKKVSEQLEYCVLRMRFACETMMGRHGKEVQHAYTELQRLAEAGSEILAMTAVLARASRAYCIGLRNAEHDMKLAACFVEKTRDNVKKLIKDIDDGEYLNLDKYKVDFGKKMLEDTNFVISKPTDRVFW